MSGCDLTRRVVRSVRLAACLVAALVTGSAQGNDEGRVVRAYGEVIGSRPVSIVLVQAEEPPADSPAPMPPPASAPVDSEMTPLDEELVEVSESETDDGLKPITSVRINITPTRGDLPPDHAAPRFANELTDLCWPGVHRPWCPNGYYWCSPGSHHECLIFEETNLERYGWNYGCAQPLISGLVFYGTMPLIPYKAALHGCREPIYTLGHYRPGNCVPYQWHLVPWDTKAALIEAGAIVGGIYAVP